MFRIVVVRNGTAISHMTIDTGQMLQCIGGFGNFLAKLTAKFTRG